MSNSDKTFIRVFRKGAQTDVEAVDVPNAQPVTLTATADRTLAVQPDSPDCDADIPDDEVVPRVIFEAFDFEDMTGTNVITTGLFLDVVDKYVQERSAGRNTFASWEVDRFSLPRPCEIIEQYATSVLDDVSNRALESVTPERNLLSVRSWARGAGRTTLAICLARRLACHGKSVVLIDGDFDNPQLASQLGVQIAAGWEVALSGENTPNSCCVSSVRDGFSMLP
ncbi:MAG: hypothetical protein KDB27_11030, partial [Planctomycetales bacterium]|nr:hypothetical protein [Planctomycetales bacterium]